jgi:hypothetical protein
MVILIYHVRITSVTIMFYAIEYGQTGFALSSLRVQAEMFLALLAALGGEDCALVTTGNFTSCSTGFVSLILRQHIERILGIRVRRINDEHSTIDLFSCLLENLDFCEEIVIVNFHDFLVGVVCVH